MDWNDIFAGLRPPGGRHRTAREAAPGWRSGAHCFWGKTREYWYLCFNLQIWTDNLLYILGTYTWCMTMCDISTRISGVSPLDNGHPGKVYFKQNSCTRTSVLLLWTVVMWSYLRPAEEWASSKCSFDVDTSYFRTCSIAKISMFSTSRQLGITTLG